MVTGIFDTDGVNYSTIMYFSAKSTTPDCLNPLKAVFPAGPIKILLHYQVSNNKEKGVKQPMKCLINQSQKGTCKVVQCNKCVYKTFNAKMEAVTCPCDLNCLSGPGCVQPAALQWSLEPVPPVRGPEAGYSLDRSLAC